MPGPPGWGNREAPYRVEEHGVVEQHLTEQAGGYGSGIHDASMS